MKTVRELEDLARQKIDKEHLKLEKTEIEASFGKLRSKIIKLHEAQSPWESETEEESASDAQDIMDLIEDINSLLRFNMYTMQNQAEWIASLESRVSQYERYIIDVNNKLKSI